MRSALLAALLTLPLAASAQSVSPLIGFSLELGGDEVVELFFEDRDSQNLTAGQGGTVFGGLRVLPSEVSPFALDATLGFKVLFNASSNADTRITRFPLAATARYTLAPGIEFGVGPVAHLGTKVHGDGFVDDLSFDPAFGATVEAGYKGFLLTYTRIGYTDEFGETYDASSVGLTARVAF